MSMLHQQFLEWSSGERVEDNRTNYLYKRFALSAIKLINNLKDLSKNTNQIGLFVSMEYI